MEHLRGIGEFLLSKTGSVTLSVDHKTRSCFMFQFLMLQLAFVTICCFIRQHKTCPTWLSCLVHSYELTKCFYFIISLVSDTFYKNRKDSKISCMVIRTWHAFWKQLVWDQIQVMPFTNNEFSYIYIITHIYNIYIWHMLYIYVV